MATVDDLQVSLRQILAAQQLQVKLLEKLVAKADAAETHRARLEQWRKDNPELSEQCHAALKELDGVQQEFLRNLIDEMDENTDVWDSEFMRLELLDKYGPRLAHLNNLRAVLFQLGPNK